MSKKTDKRLVIFIYAAIVVVTLVAFAPVRHSELLNYDDLDHVIKNYHIHNGISFGSGRWAFTTRFFESWIPLAWLSHALDCQMFGLDGGGHHITSLLIHLANSPLPYLYRA